MLLQGYVCGIHNLHPKQCISYCLRYLLNYFCTKRIKEYSTHFKLIFSRLYMILRNTLRLFTWMTMMKF